MRLAHPLIYVSPVSKTIVSDGVGSFGVQVAQLEVMALCLGSHKKSYSCRY